MLMMISFVKPLSPSSSYHAAVACSARERAGAAREKKTEHVATGAQEPEQLRRQLLISMLKREEELRLSTAWQQRFAEAEQSDTRDWLMEVDVLQRQVVLQFGFFALSSAGRLLGPRGLAMAAAAPPEAR